MKKPSYQHLRRARLVLLAVTLTLVVLTQMVPGWGDAYARTVYPHVAGLLSALSGLVPFAVGDLFIALSLVGVASYPFYAHFARKKTWIRAWGGSAEYLAWVYVWFYAAWGLNYAQADFYERTHIAPVRYTEADFRDFTRRYVSRLNESYTALTAVDRDLLCRDVVEGYRQIAPALGIHAPSGRRLPRVKTMLFSSLASRVGFKGSMGPFFCEFTVNGEVPPSEYPATYAHELSHLLGISNEGEANFYAYVVCTRSRVDAIRFSGYLSLLPHVLNNAYRLLDSEAYAALCLDIRPEVMQLAQANQAFWQSRYNDFVGRIQSSLYEMYLKGNRIAEGQKSYSQVIGLLIAYEKSAAAHAPAPIS